MAKLASNIKNVVKKTDVAQIAQRKIIGDDKYNQVYDSAHFLTTPMIQARQATKDAENAANAIKDEPVMPVPDDELLARNKKKALARSNRGRASTILGGSSDAETLG